MAEGATGGENTLMGRGMDEYGMGKGDGGGEHINE